jgi:exodeoxyribonuclease VIII
MAPKPITVSTVEALNQLHSEGKLAGSIVSCPIDVYHDGPGVSSSGLKEILRSPAHYQAYLAEKKDSKALRIGRLTHMAVLEPELFADTVVPEPKFDRRTTVGKAAAEAFAHASEGMTIVAPSEYDVAVAIRDAVHASPLAQQVIAKGQSEIAVYWNDQATGILCKARADYLRNDMIIDLKTTEDARAYSFRRDLEKYRYHLSAAFYLDGFSQVLGTQVGAFAWIAAEKRAPYGIGYYAALPECIQLGRVEYRDALQTLAKCRATNKWPAYAETFQNIGTSSWYAAKEIV